MKSARRWATIMAVAVALLAAAVLALAFDATPASAFAEWQHDGAVTCQVCHGQGTPTDASCTTCHSGFRSYPGRTCWSCHAPGQDTSTLSSPSSACTQGCHLWDSPQKQYLIPFTHGPRPHLGASADCRACHGTSISIVDPGTSPHHSGRDTGFGKCGSCHPKPQRHAGKVACTTCHKRARAFHLFQANSPGYTKCGACHTKRHAGKRVPQGKCTACHKGTSGRAARHSSRITKRFVCGGCHSKPLHARAVSTAVKSCRTCHTGKFHARQPRLGNATCTKCHSSARRHANGFQCTLCHRRAVHNARPSATNFGGSIASGGGATSGGYNGFTRY